MSHKFSEEIRQQVCRRADFLCEYCHTNERWQYVRFTVDHVLPDGGDSLENLALACFHCNRRKSDKTSFQNIPLFNPRTQIWKEHFAWSEDKIRIIPKTEIGRVTTELLNLNRPRILQIRQADTEVLRHPPNADLT